MLLALTRTSLGRAGDMCQEGERKHLGPARPPGEPGRRGLLPPSDRSGTVMEEATALAGKDGSRSGRCRD